MSNIELSSQVSNQSLKMLMKILEPGFKKTNHLQISVCQAIKELNDLFSSDHEEIRSLNADDFGILCKAINAWLMLQTLTKFSIKTQSLDSKTYYCVRRKKVKSNKQVQIEQKCYCGYTISQKNNESLITSNKNSIEHIKECKPFTEQDVRKNENFINGVVTKPLGLFFLFLINK